MKRFALITLLFAAPLAVMAQTPVFTDNFNNGSTTNKTSTPGGTATVSSTSYDIASSKNATTGPAIAPGLLRLNYPSAGSGFIEAQAVFTAAPVTLNSVGDYINLTYTFTNTTGTLIVAGQPSSYLVQGLYNSSATIPVTNGALLSSGLSSTVFTFATNFCQGWKGYVSRISNGGTSSIYTRPAQTQSQISTGGSNPGANSDQDLLGNGWGGGTYTNPPGSTLGNETTNVSLATGSPYTISYTIALTAAGTLTVTNNLYDGVGVGGALLFSQTNNASGTTNLTQTFDSLCIGVRYSATGSPEIDISQIAVTKSIFGSPGPTFFVTGGGAGCPGDPFAVNLSGSVSSNAYYLYTNGVYDADVAPQTGTGSPLVFGPISVVGTNTIVASNTVSGFTGLMAGQAVISILPGPVITTQPAPVIVASGYLGAFNVTATGGGLGYQWYKNGTALTDIGEFSGSHTANLIINPATSADAATSANGYYVVITNSCGLSATSTTNGLTIVASANLTWSGNNPNTNWDLSTTANWNTGSANFNSGDNVRFDDSSAYPNVRLVGNLEPASVIESASQTYSFSGTGSIIGPSSLTMNGTGTLIISNANTYTGGTVINSGTVNQRNSTQQALGTGPVTLNGGKLEIGLATGGPTAGFSNLNVTADSVLQPDVASTYSFVLQNAWTGTSGATLTINNALNNSASLFRMRFYGAYTNNSSILLSTAGNMTEVAPYNPSGDQVYNGIISGNGGRITLRGAGNVIFNNTNSFNDFAVNAQGAGPGSGGNGVPYPAPGYGYSIQISGGNLGIGADSTPDFIAASSTSPAPGGQGASPLGTGYLGINFGPTEGGNANIFASGGAHTVANPIIYSTANTNFILSITGTNNLTLSGQFNLNGVDGSGNTNRIISVSNTGLTTLSGLITDSGLNCGITKTGTGPLYLDATNDYTGSTIVSNGMLAGIGVISGPVTVASTGTISGGDAGVIGSLTISNNLTLGGNAQFKVNKSVAPSNDVVVVIGSLNNTGTGTLTVTNTGPALVAGDRFVVFSQALVGGATMTISPAPGSGLAWSNNLAVDGSIKVVVSGVAPAPVASFSGTPRSGTAPLSVAFTDASTGSITNWIWNFGDGVSVTNSSNVGVNHSYAAGTFTVSLTAQGPGGSSLATSNNYIVVAVPAPVADFTGSPTNIFVTQTVTFTDASTGSITNWIWNFGDGSASVTNTTSANISHSYIAAGTYTVSLTANGAGGSNTKTRSNYIVVVNKPVFSKPVLSSGSLVLGGVNGPVGQQYRILSSTSATLALSSWTPIYTNVVASDGSFGYTNASLAGSGKFFILVSP